MTIARTINQCQMLNEPMTESPSRMWPRSFLDVAGCAETARQLIAEILQRQTTVRHQHQCVEPQVSEFMHELTVIVVLGGDDGLRRLLAHFLGDRINPFLIEAGDVRSLGDRNLARLRSEEHTSELKSLMRLSYAVFC